MNGVMDIIDVLKEVIDVDSIGWYNCGIEQGGGLSLKVSFYQRDSYWIDFVVDYDYGSLTDPDFVITKIDMSPKWWLEEIHKAIIKAVSVDEKGNYYLADDEKEKERKEACNEICDMIQSFEVSLDTYEIMRDEFKKKEKYKYVADIMNKYIKEVLEPAHVKMKNAYEFFDENWRETYAKRR